MARPTEGSPVVSAEWIEANLDDPSVRLVEVDVSAGAYDDGHIPGAVLWNAYTDLRGSDYMPVVHAELEGLLSRAGIERRTTLVFYGYGGVLGYWLMKAHGHTDVRLLEGPRDQWSEIGGAWDTEVPEETGTSLRLPPADARILASRSSVEAAVGDSGPLLVDVRSDLEFDGSRFWPSGATEDTGRSGHIPGAVSVPIELLREEDGSLKPPETLRKVFEDRGVTPDRSPILYCTIGNRAAQAWFALTEILGYPSASVYYNSWVEWGRVDDTPIES